MNIMEINFLNLENYKTGAQFCRASNGTLHVIPITEADTKSTFHKAN
jgi:hypothetical protein